MSIKDNLIHLIKDFPSCIVSTNELCGRYWSVYDCRVPKFTNCTPASSITRAFRKLKEKGDIII